MRAGSRVIELMSGVCFVSGRTVARASRVRAVEAERDLDARLDGLDEPGQVVGLAVGMGPRVDIDPVGAGVGLTAGERGDERGVPLEDRRADALARAVDLLADDREHAHPRSAAAPTGVGAWVGAGVGGWVGNDIARANTRWNSRRVVSST